jgi:hypothetical protein
MRTVLPVKVAGMTDHFASGVTEKATVLKVKGLGHEDTSN